MVWWVLLLAISWAGAQKLHPLSEEYINEINSKQSMWKAGRNFEIEEYDLFKILASGVIRSNKTRVYKRIHNEQEDVPESFDAREAWPECADNIGLIRDQSRCGSCWAFAVVKAISDRICIHSNATRKMLVSAQHLLTCENAGGCRGGDPDDAWETWKNDGIVIGGLYNSTDQGCQSYFLAPCDDHMSNCRDYVETPECKRVCDDSSLQFKEQKTYGHKHCSILGEVKQIQLEIFKNGPVEAQILIYSDFANCKSGIYQKTSTEYVGLHDVKIIGWKVENGTKYWTIANSWNERWGENGFFRIIRGQNEAAIESEITAELPDFSRF